MAVIKEKSVAELIGDFYQAHATGDGKMRAEALEKLQNLIFTGMTDSQPFIEYYNEVFSGRTSFNTQLNVSDYPKESIIRELFQNTFGCVYKTDDMKIIVDFVDGNEIHISYNEVGFNLEDILFYLSYGRNNGDPTREGRFGVGAKSVFMNVEWLALRSNNFSFKIEKEHDQLLIRNLDLFGVPFKGTKIIVKVNETEFAKIRENFITLTEKRGDYIDLVELCFAFNRKKIMNNAEDSKESLERSVNIAVMENGAMNTVYKIVRHQKSEHDSPVIRFLQNNKGIVDFLFYENEGFVYLVPYAVANTKRESVVAILKGKYNYFSTFELTGLISADNETFINEKLSAFFVSVPNQYVTTCRTGIKSECEEKVAEAIESDLVKMFEYCKKYFILEMHQKQDEDVYFMYPKSYVFDFFKSFIENSRYAAPIKNKFISNISLIFPDNPEIVLYEDLAKTSFQCIKSGIGKSEFEDGSADKLYIEDQIEELESKLSDINNKSIYVSYLWENGDGSESGKVYKYKFERDGKTYIIDSRKLPGLSDYNLYANFPTIIGFFLQNYLVENCVMDEDALENILTLYDDACSEDYELMMKYYRIYFNRGDEEYSFEVSKMNVGNIKNAMDTVVRRKNRFISSQNYAEVVAMLFNSFTQGKDTMSFLREIKEQGGTITLELDFNKKYRFAVYGRQFMIPSSITNVDLLEILGDAQHLIGSGILTGRMFDFPYGTGIYSFDKSEVASLLKDSTPPETTSKEIKAVFSKVFVANFRSDDIAIVDEDNKIIAIKDTDTPITPEERAAASKYIILRDDYSKAEYADVIEYIIVGKTEHILNRYFSRTREPNQILLDQIPNYLKPMPHLTKEEFGFVREQYAKISGENGTPNFKNYFSKDINSKIFGYGGKCEACNYESNVINSFTIKEFKIGLITDETERDFKFSLYLCGNDASVSDGWLFSDISIGGMQPFTWLEEIKQADVIPAEFLFCRIKYSPQLTYDIMSVEANQCDSVIDAPMQTIDIKLTPLMAAKWIADNAEE